MNTPSESCGEGDGLKLPDEETKGAVHDSNSENKLADDDPSPSLSEVFDSVNDATVCTEDDEDVMGDFLILDSVEDEKASSQNDSEPQLTGSQESSEPEDLHLVLSDDNELDSQTDAEKGVGGETSPVDMKEESNNAPDKEQSKNTDSASSQEKTYDEIPVKESSGDLNVSDNLINSERSNDSSDVFKLTAEEEKICPPLSDSLLNDDDEDVRGKQASAEIKNVQNSNDVNENICVEKQTPFVTKQSIESNVSDSSTNCVAEDSQEVEQQLEGVVEKLKENHAASGSSSETETSLSKSPVASADSGTPSPYIEQQTPVAIDSSSKNEIEADDTVKRVESVDISSTLPCGLFRDDSLEEFSLSPKDVLSLGTDGGNSGADVNGLHEADQAMSIEDIIDNLSSPIGEDANSTVDESASGKSEIEAVMEVVQTEAEAVVGVVQTEAEAVMEVVQTEAEAVMKVVQTEAESVTEIVQAEAESVTEIVQAEAESMTEIVQTEAEAVTEIVQTEEKRTNKRPAEPDAMSNDRVEVKKVKLDIVFNEKTADSDPEKPDATKNVTSSVVSAEEEKENINVNGDVTNMDLGGDDDIDIIEEKYSEKKEEVPDENRSVVPDVAEKETLAVKDEKPEIKVNGIATDHSDEDVNNEEVHFLKQKFAESLVSQTSDKFHDEMLSINLAMTKRIEILERSLEKSKKRLIYYQSMLGNLTTEHRRQLAKLGYLPKVHTRTVGVNVRILQEHELQSTNRLRMVKDSLAPPSTSATPAQPTPVLTNTSMQLAQATAKKCIFPRAATPVNISSGPRMPAPNVTVSQINVNTPGIGSEDKIRAPSSMQIIPSVSQGATTSPQSVPMMNRPRIQPSILRRQPVPKSPGSVTSTASIVLLSNPGSNTSTVASSSSINVIDLTEDSESNLTTTTAATSQSSAVLVSPSVTRGPSNNLVPMPLVGSLNSVVQIIPSGPHMSSSISGGNAAIRVGRPPTVLPSSACLPQGQRVAYLLQQNPGTIVMPRMDGQVSQIGNLQPHQSPFVTSSGQHVPTFLVRMNAPPNPAPVVSSNTISTTKPTVTQSSAPVSLPSGKSSSTMLISCVAKHPAPLPPAPSYTENKSLKSLPPKPALKISKVSNGIVLSWNMSLFNSHAEIATYQLFAYQENDQAVSSSLWRKVGDVKALPLPMACTLTQFVEGHKYHFAVRAVDIHSRIGPFSDVSSIVLLPRSGQVPPK